MNKISYYLLELIIICFFLLNGVGFGGLSLWNYLLIVLNIITIIRILRIKRLKISLNFKRFLIVNIILLFWISLVYLVSFNIGFGLIRTIQILNCFLAVMSILLTINDMKKLINTINLIIIIMFITSIFAIGQFYIGGIFNSVWEITQYGNTYYTIADGRSPGLAGNPVELSYQLILILPFFILKNFSNKNKPLTLFQFFGVLIILLALLVNQTRSSIIASVLLLIFFIFFIFFKKNINVLSKLFIGMVTFITLLSGIFVFDNLDITSRFHMDTSASLRIPMLEMAFRYSMDYPFGSGIYKPSLNYINPEFYMYAEEMMSTTSHNSIINMLIYYGYVGAFLYLILLYLITKFLLNLIRSLRNIKNNSNSSWVCFALLFSFLLYTFNSMFHNAAMFTGDFKIWLIIGLAFSLESIIKNKDEVK